MIHATAGTLAVVAGCLHATLITPPRPILVGPTVKMNLFKVAGQESGRLPCPRPRDAERPNATIKLRLPFPLFPDRVKHLTDALDWPIK